MNTTVKRRARKAKPAIGIALAGGGPLAAVYEIGVLAALEESISGLDVNDADIYVGISAGGIVAAGLANGISPHQMVRLFIESDVDKANGTPLFKPELLLRPASAEFRKRIAMVPGLVAESMFHYARKRNSLMSSFERMKEALPTGVLSGAGIDDYLKATFSRQGRSNDFRKLAHKLIVVATDLDTGEAVRFGSPGWDSTPISLAVQASAAVPGLFPPVDIKGRHFVDGALRKTLHASIALEAGVDVLFCVNAIVPYRASGHNEPGKLASGGLFNVLSQTLRSILHSRMQTGMGNYARTYPDADILLFQPNHDDAELFFTNIFSYSNRRRMCERAYQNTRLMLLARRDEIGPKLARNGLALKLSVLRDASLTLVEEVPSNAPLARLEQVLDDLERYLKVAHS